MKIGFFDFDKRKSYNFIIDTVVKTMGISRKEAQKRNDALFKSGLLENFKPDDVFAQLLIENFMRFNGKKLDYEQVFVQTMNFPALVSRYDFEYRANLTETLRHMEDDDDYDFAIIKSEIQKFDKFFFEVVWTALQIGYGHPKPIPIEIITP